jgi:hypothetical protein
VAAKPKLTIATSSLKTFIVQLPSWQARYAKLESGVKAKAARGSDYRKDSELRNSEKG